MLSKDVESTPDTQQGKYSNFLIVAAEVLKYIKLGEQKIYINYTYIILITILT